MKAALATLAVALASPIAALVVPRASPPAGYDVKHLENYDVYHTRYLALGCQNKHNTPFFDRCCRPMAAGQKLDSRPAECNPNIIPKPTTLKPTPQPVPTPKAVVNNQAQANTGGHVTYYYQNGVAGACGKVNPDSAFIAAMDYRRYGNTSVKSPLCGKRVQIKNIENGNTVVVTVADACPTCDNANSIDLSVAAFQKLAPLSKGLLKKIEWSFV